MQSRRVGRNGMMTIDQSSDHTSDPAKVGWLYQKRKASTHHTHANGDTRVRESGADESNVVENFGTFGKFTPLPSPSHDLIPSHPVQSHQDSRG